MANFSYENLSDSELVGRCVNRDAVAWSQLVERFSKLVFWAIKERLSSRGCYCSQEDLADIFQSIFTSLWIKNTLKQIKNRQKIKTWLIMVAGNMAIDFVRKSSMQQAKDQTCVYQSISERLPEEDDIENPRTSAIRSELKNLIEEEIEKLDPKEKTVLTLDVYYDMKHRDISEIVKMPVNTISTIIARSKDKIRQALKDKGVEIF